MKRQRLPSDFVTIVLIPEDRYQLKCTLHALALAKNDTPCITLVLGLNPSEDLLKTGRLDNHASLTYDGPIVHKKLQLFCAAMKTIESRYVVHVPDQFIPGDYWLDRLCDLKTDENITSSFKTEVGFSWDKHPYENGFFFEKFTKDVNRIMTDVFMAIEKKQITGISLGMQDSIVLFDSKPIKDGLVIPLEAWMLPNATLNDVLVTGFTAKGFKHICVETSVVTTVDPLEYDLPQV